MTIGSRAYLGALTGLAAAVLLSGCASDHRSIVAPASVIPATRATPLPTTLRLASKPAVSVMSTAPPTCRTRGSGFELSLVEGFRGAPDPVGAARWFVRRGGAAGFGTSSSVWVLTDPGNVKRGEATLVDGSVSLHALRLPNGTWAIDSGARCG